MKANLHRHAFKSLPLARKMIVAIALLSPVAAVCDGVGELNGLPSRKGVTQSEYCPNDLNSVKIIKSANQTIRNVTRGGSTAHGLGE